MAQFEVPGTKMLLGRMLLSPLPERVYEQLTAYIRLLYYWNDRMNLTAVRNPETLVGLHIGECVRCAQRIPETASTVLDFGSGAGLPGIPIQIVRPELAVTLAESQNKKAAFLREVLRELELTNAAVSAKRVELLPANQTFDVVTLRAVDNMGQALQDAESRVGDRGCCMVLTSSAESPGVLARLPQLCWESDPIPGTRQRVLLTGRKF